MKRWSLEFADGQGISGRLQLTVDAEGHSKPVASFHAQVVMPEVGVVVVRDDEAEAATSDRGERVAVGFDLEWETPDRVVGEVLVGRARHAIDGTGTFTMTPTPTQHASK